MLQTLATLGSLILSAGAIGVIVQAFVEDGQAFEIALRGATVGDRRLPARTQRVAAPRAARIIQLDVAVRVQRAVA